MRQLFVAPIFMITACMAWTSSPSSCRSFSNVQPSRSALCTHRTCKELSPRKEDFSRSIKTKIVAPWIAGCAVLLFSNAAAICPVKAYDPSDYASETVQGAMQNLKEARSADRIVAAYENIAEIITEGKGVGGQINYKGIQLDRGYVADEDTSIYNPGLTLLTESEKDRLVEAIVNSRKNAESWNVDTQAGFDFLREKLDPLHMYELRGYLGILPFYGAAVYLAVFGVQQLARDLFPIAYFVGVLAVFGPAIALVLAGPQ